MFRPQIWTIAILVLAACQPAADPATADVLIIGDSIMEWNLDQSLSISDVIAEETGLVTANAAISGAEFLGQNDSIPSQYVAGPWDWVVLDGGANDLVGFCGQDAAATVLDALIGADVTSGAMPEFFSRVRDDGASLVVIGYYFAPVGGDEFSDCTADFINLNMRLEQYAAQTDGVFYAPAADVIPTDDLTFYDEDLVHPSPEGSRMIGVQIADIITDAG